MATPARSTNDAIMALKRASQGTPNVNKAPVTTQPVTPKTNTQSTYSTTSNSNSRSSNDMTGKTSYMWKDGQLISVNNDFVDQFKGNGYELDNGQLSSLQQGKPQQGYGTITNLPSGMSEDQYFREYMGTTANDYYGNIASQNGYQTQAQSQSNSEYDARIASLEKMLQDMQNKNNYNNAQPGANTGVDTSGSSGEHIFDSGNSNPQAGQVGFTQGTNSMNDALFRYLNNLWNGGF